MRILILQHDADDPPMLLGEWLAETGADLQVRRAYAGDEIPADTEGFDRLVCLGGAMGAEDDELAPWLPATRDLLARATADGTPTLAVCLGAQLLAVATGGTVERGEYGPEVGAYLTAKRDAAEKDPVFGWLPMTPDVMHCHLDVISELPPGAALLLTGTGPYPHQAFRVGEAAWGLQFHIEAPAAVVREWAAADGLTGRLGPELDDAEANMAEVWRDIVHRFVSYRPRLPLAGNG